MSQTLFLSIYTKKKDENIVKSQSNRIGYIKKIFHNIVEKEIVSRVYINEVFHHHLLKNETLFLLWEQFGQCKLYIL